MLTRLIIRNFKRFEEVDIELGNPVVFIGPNNSGKTTALQALALWDIGLRRWQEKRAGKPAPKHRPGVTINRRDLLAAPVPEASALWRDLHLRDVSIVEGKQQTRNVRIDITIEGVTDGKQWICGLEFDYANEESFYCRPLRQGEGKNPDRMPVPPGVADVGLTFLQPMSGLAASEVRMDPGAVEVRLGEGRTAEVLRNLCYRLANADDDRGRWSRLCEQIESLFGVTLEEPLYISQRGELVMGYCNPGGVRLDLSTAGRGLQQTLLLLAHLALNRGFVLLLDEPDAHLEILRQRQTYQILTETAQQHGSQVIAASHSEVILNEAADRDVVVAFVGKPHRIDDRGSQVLKSLKQIGFDQYYQAEQTGWVLYLEGPTDLAILRSFARLLEHPARQALERPFVQYIQNQPQQARDHFRGLREAKQDLVGYTLCDHLDHTLQPTPELDEHAWQRREIENYLCQPETLGAYAEALSLETAAGALFEQPQRQKVGQVMQGCIEDLVPPVALRDRADSWWVNTKASTEFLDRLFAAFFKKLELPNLMRKTDYHILARHVPRDQIDAEVTHVLDGILGASERAAPAGEGDVRGP